MPVTINGDGSITGFVAQTANIANGAIGTNQLANGAATQAKRTYAAGEIVQVKEYVEQGSFTLQDNACHYGQNWIPIAQLPRMAPVSPSPTPQSSNARTRQFDHQGRNQCLYG